MRLVIASALSLSAGSPRICRPRRLLLFKADGSGRRTAAPTKPLNWIGPPCCDRKSGGQAPVWVVENKAERAAARHYRRNPGTTVAHELGVDPGLVKDGVGPTCRRCCRACQLLGEGYTLVRREYMTAIRTVDLLCPEQRGSVAVEIRSGVARSTAWSS